VVLVWIVELLNSALEALADEISLGERERLGRAKDLGSAAVMGRCCWRRRRGPR
jgi:diacylglycerol kinase (ATP)